MKQYVMCNLLALPVLIFFVCETGQTGDKKIARFKAFLPKDAYKELAARSIKTIEEAAKVGDANAVIRIETEAMILASVAMSDKSGSADTAIMLGAAFMAAEAAQKKNVKQPAELTRLIAKGDAGSQNIGKLKAHDLNELMYLFRGKAKGGEGIHVDLQYQPKLKNLNGIEALIGALATKKLNDANLEKVAKELTPLAYPVAVIGVVTHETAPDKDAKKWRDLSIDMRDSAIGVAEATQKKDADGIMKAALALETSCTACHMAFKKN